MSENGFQSGILHPAKVFIKFERDIKMALHIKGKAKKGTAHPSQRTAGAASLHQGNILRQRCGIQNTGAFREERGQRKREDGSMGTVRQQPWGNCLDRVGWRAPGESFPRT